jgi:hypothetical protein
MPRYFLVAGIDFGTSFTKVVLRDNNTPGSRAVVVEFPAHREGLLPSLVGVVGDSLIPSDALNGCATVPYLKMLAAHVARGSPLENSRVRVLDTLNPLRRSQNDSHVVRNLLAFYLAHVIAATEDFIRTRSPWRDFDFSPGNENDFLVFQLAVPTGLLTDNGATEKLFQTAFVAGYALRSEVAGQVHHNRWNERVETVLAAGQAIFESRYKQWQCLLYPEVAAAVQTVFRSPNAHDGLYITMDVGAGTVDLNAFNRNTGQHLPQGEQANAPRDLNYYAAIVCQLGVQNLNDPHRAVERRQERELMAELRQNLQTLYLRGIHYQPNHGTAPGHRTWDRATLFIFGGGALHRGYKENFAAGLEYAGINSPQIQNLPAAQDLVRPRGVEFGRFAVAYGLSFFRPSLDHVRLPNELTPFHILYPATNNPPPREYGFNWDD